MNVMDYSQIRENLLNLKNEAVALISDTDSLEELKRLRVLFLGRKGKINKAVKKIKLLEPTQKKEIGTLLNDTKKTIEQTLEDQTKRISAPKTGEWIDVTLPAKHPPLGHIHPVSQAIEEITMIFERIGFTRVRYPEVEWDWYAFESLNMPKGHPARDEWETFFINTPSHKKLGALVLTPHTSNGQVREMKRLEKPPIRMLNIAKCYRRQQDVTHTIMFHQFEGLVIDEDISIQHLKGTIDYFAHQFYGESTKSRLRPFHFQFTEPSFEVDFTCTICEGRGKLTNGTRCRFCKSGWHEVAGAGMVHPRVLKAGGIDPEKYTGFAFGMGVERAYTLKPGLKLDDIRIIYQNDLRFLEQF
jgi:phenylalanyl-tRNA synthetase alpha chain